MKRTFFTLKNEKFWKKRKKRLKKNVMDQKTVKKKVMDQKTVKKNVFFEKNWYLQF